MSKKKKHKPVKLGPPCPRCGSRRTAERGELFACADCEALFDGNPNEGGDWSDHNPAARLEREERRRHGAGSH